MENSESLPRSDSTPIAIAPSRRKIKTRKSPAPDEKFDRRLGAAAKEIEEERGRERMRERERGWSTKGAARGKDNSSDARRAFRNWNAPEFAPETRRPASPPQLTGASPFCYCLSQRENCARAVLLLAWRVSTLSVIDTPLVINVRWNTREILSCTNVRRIFPTEGAIVRAEIVIDSSFCVHEGLIETVISPGNRSVWSSRVIRPANSRRRLGRRRCVSWIIAVSRWFDVASRMNVVSVVHGDTEAAWLQIDRPNISPSCCTD